MTDRQTTRRKIWASYADTRLSGSALQLHRTEREAYECIAQLFEEFWESMPRRACLAFWRRLDLDWARFTTEFRAAADRYGVSYHIDEIELPEGIR